MLLNANEAAHIEFSGFEYVFLVDFVIKSSQIMHLLYASNI